MIIYRVEFNQFTNGLRNTVWDGKNYLNIPRTGFLIREEDISYYAKLGNGFSRLECVGELKKPDEEGDGEGV